MLALDPQALDDAAGRIGAVAASLTCLDVAEPFRVAGEAVPRSATAEACWWVATDLEAAVDAWADHVSDLCETARLVARDVASTDESVAEAMRAATP